ncbi:ATP-binding cassette domain-containing protein [Lactococcus hircilactis]|uniref:ATP-binding cassette domain-containing protein n=1 Tax=Lactococcus hircilactis TaxID=1494462 RepID=A0A7X1Z8M1_9LACT|nr:AAA family ATPase [Lactococcus hircilactis]MQW39753.1 ATP-binding cassette domain-containing protein [Lactococcus hircilactis]
MGLKIKNLKIPDISPLDFEIVENGLYGVIGRNGIGKSTLFGILSGEIGFSQGKIESGRVAYLPDVESFEESLKMKDYFELLKTKEKDKAKALVSIFGADTFQKKRIGQFSLGMKQLFATILSFSIDCDLLIIDELFSGLDVSKKALVYEEVKKVVQEKIVLLTSHNLKEIEHFCNQTYLLSESGLNLVTDFDEAAKEIGYMDVFF